ncbi:MAG: HDIG domain-containing metalloprotein [Planctomycetota bacterium]
MPDPTTTTTPSSKRRRAGTKSRAGRRRIPWRELALIPNLLQMSLIIAASVLASAAVLHAFRDTILLVPGRMADRSHVVRAEFSIVDQEATDRDREDARRRTPRVYTADVEAIEVISASLLALPATLAASESLDAVPDEIRGAFALDEPAFARIRELVDAGVPTAAWETRVDRFVRGLRTTPVLLAEEFGLAQQSTAGEIVLLEESGARTPVSRDAAVSVASPDAGERLMRRISAGLTEDDAQVMVARALSTGVPTFVFDQEAMETLRTERADAVPDVLATYLVGQPIVLQGEEITSERARLAKEEAQQFRDSRSFVTQTADAVGSLAVAAALIAVFVGYVRRYSPRAGRHPLRSAVLSGIVILGAAVACWGSGAVPEARWFMTLAPVALTAMVVVTAFDRRLAVMAAATQSVLISLALGLSAGYFTAALVAAIVSAASLDNVRHRHDVLRGGIAVGTSLLITTLAVNLLTRPVLPATVVELFIDSAWAGSAGFLAAAVTLVALPSVERVFDVTTGMTLSELRDSSHPVLRQLQQRAPGTFNHSHTVAIIAEAAADAIEADSMHVYVGAMYHDIGKMNKPEYFIENQTAGQAPVHARLSPAMSLLVIVAHVKDGVELAKEAGLPRSLQHYIESHHGTNLVQYFFERAKQRAEEDTEDSAVPSEIEYRYPGPKPRTREAAVLMLADSVEAATRAMAEPNPARISSLVREISRKYLDDGQFDEAAITLRDLHTVEESIIKSLNGIYHGRIAYPKGDKARPTSGDEAGTLPETPEFDESSERVASAS